ncbi:MAG: hypothetical protein SGPRY_003685 [Prymnesium sp.]
MTYLVHRDMKPSNLLLNSECLMKVADFGLARSLQKSTQNVLTDYVATRWYRAPEILLGSTRYGKAVDMWSLGCIFGEMLGNKPVFPGQSTLNQLERICEVVGSPTEQEIEAMDSPFAKTMLDSLQQPRKGVGKGWKALYPNASSSALDMLNKLMQFDPNRRMSAHEGLRHGYCAQFFDAQSEEKATTSVSIDIDDNDKKSTSIYRDKLYSSMIDKKGGLKKREQQSR